MSRHFSEVEVLFQELACNVFAAVLSFFCSAHQNADCEREAVSQELISSKHYNDIRVGLIKKLPTLREIALEGGSSKTKSTCISTDLAETNSLW